MKVAFFCCLTCNHTIQVKIDCGKIDKPVACPCDICASVGTLSLVHNCCKIADRQVIQLQETPDVIPDGQTPLTVSLSVYDELVDVSKPGNCLLVMGMFRSVPVRMNPQRQMIKSLFKTFLDSMGPHKYRSHVLPLPLIGCSPGWYARVSSGHFGAWAARALWVDVDGNQLMNIEDEIVDPV